MDFVDSHHVLMRFLNNKQMKSLEATCIFTNELQHGNETWDHLKFETCRIAVQGSTGIEPFSRNLHSNSRRKEISRSQSYVQCNAMQIL